VSSEQHIIVVDLGYGDAGKGTIVDWLCAPSTRESVGGRPVQAVVRFNGGAQAAHHVLAPDGQPHPFAQFGSGTFTRGTRTFLSRYMLIDPLALVAEAEHLKELGVQDPLGLVAADRDALLTTPYHRAANQARELARGPDRHGSCGVGIGETARYALAYPDDAPRAGDMTAPSTLVRKLALLRDRLPADLVREFAGQPGFLATLGSVGFPGFPVNPDAVNPGAGERERLPSTERVADVYRAVAGQITLAGDGYLKELLSAGPVVFEGAQGVLLDEWRGFHPYTTWSTTTFENAETLLRENGAEAEGARLGVTRTYQTRHGPGPFPTEDPALGLTEPHNADGRWQGPVRVGHLDAVALGYAAAVVGGVDAVALTHLDTACRPGSELRICRAYELTDGIAVTMVPGPPRDLSYQESLTAQLLQARPCYDTAERSTADEWADAVAGILWAPVVIRSHGPALTDKTWHRLKALSR
jgi:adenylosuccinate synthase